MKIESKDKCCIDTSPIDWEARQWDATVAAMQGNIIKGSLFLADEIASRSIYTATELIKQYKEQI